MGGVPVPSEAGASTCRPQVAAERRVHICANARPVTLKHKGAGFTTWIWFPSVAAFSASRETAACAEQNKSRRTFLPNDQSYDLNMITASIDN